MACVNPYAMSGEWKTIRVPKDVFEDAKQRKEEHNVTWGEYVNPHAWHSVFDEPQETQDVSDNITSVVDATQADVHDAKADIMNRIDDLENTLPRKIGEELQR